MTRVTVSAICAVVTLVDGAPAPEPVVHVPRGAAVVIDGRIDDAEWRQSAVRELSDGTVIRLQHDRRYLFLGIGAARRGFPSVCVANAGTVQILHASAALGRVSYVRGEQSWTARDTEFVYGMRTPDLTEMARDERRAYLAQHGWVGSTFRMSDGRTQELQISLDLMSTAPAVAIGFFAMKEGDSFDIVRWPETMPAADGCASADLVRGRVPQHLQFNPTTWAELRLAQ